MSDEGGGASRSTDPAAGSSAATDVSLREYVMARIDALDRHMTSEVEALRRETESARDHSDRAIEVAAHEASERLAAHNGLIEQMQKQGGTFATRESVDDFKETNNTRVGKIERFQWMLTGGMLLAVFIGSAALVKVFSG